MLSKRIILSLCRLSLTNTPHSNILCIRTMATPPKMMKPTQYIGTHDGTFHCDDVTACFMLKQLDRFKKHDILRTRDPMKLEKAEIVVDVGAELDIPRLRLDHHQRSFNLTIKDYHPTLRTTNLDKAVRLSSAGLVYAIFGKDLIVTLLNLGKHYGDLNPELKEMIDAIYEKTYVEYIEEIDAIDNGVELVSGDNLIHNYHINSGISNRIARLNPLGDATPESRMERFEEAMDVVGNEIVEGIEYLAEHWWPKRQELKKCVMNRETFDPSGQMVLIDSKFLSGWKSAFLDFERDLEIVGQLKFIIFCDESEQSPWRATAVPVDPKSFTSRAPFKEEWRGKRDKELQEVSGVSDATFVHMSGFTGGAKSLEGIRSLVRKSLGLE